ncbi:MAG TPA: nucleotidyltransferase domain-containing protein, partial [Polyangiales bacterium]|nr:nucleotidyltransferase domain-containing protein [Polyangiales bacterium]
MKPHHMIAQQLSAARGVVSIALGGSRAQGTERSDSDWDLGVFYRGELDLSVLEQYGTVYPPGSWGRLMNGGAWLTIDGIRVDVLLRDLDVVEHWSARADQGAFEIDALLGYVAGVPTYSLLAERALSLPLHGPWPDKLRYPDALCERAPERWRFNARFALDYAAKHASRGDRVGTVSMAGRAVIEEAHARLCEQKRWILNEKNIVQVAGLAHLQAHFAAQPN